MPPEMLPLLLLLLEGERRTYTHGEGATKIVQDDIGTRVARVIHGGGGWCGLQDEEADAGACAVRSFRVRAGENGDDDGGGFNSRRAVGGIRRDGGVDEGCVRAQLRRGIVGWLADIWRRDDRGKAAKREISCARANHVGAGQLLFRLWAHGQPTRPSSALEVQ